MFLLQATRSLLCHGRFDFPSWVVRVAHIVVQCPYDPDFAAALPDDKSYRLVSIPLSPSLSPLSLSPISPRSLPKNLFSSLLVGAWRARAFM